MSWTAHRVRWLIWIGIAGFGLTVVSFRSPLWSGREVEGSARPPAASVRVSLQQTSADEFDRRLIFPQIANGSSDRLQIRSSVLILNNGYRTAHGQIRLTSDKGASWSLGTSAGTGSLFDFALESGGLLRIESDGAGDVAKGWAEVVADQPVSGSASYVVLNAGGSFLSEVGIGDSPSANDRMIYVERSGAVDTALAVCNPGDSTANLELELRTLDGNAVETQLLSVGPGAQDALYLSALFPQQTDFQGVLVASGSKEVSLVALRTRDVNFTSLPSALAASSGSESQVSYFSRIGDGGFGLAIGSESDPSVTTFLDLRTTFLVLNPFADSVSAQLDLFDSSGNPWAMQVDGEMADSFSLEVPAGGAVRLVSDGATDPGDVGWARLTADQPLKAQALFEIRQSPGDRFVSELGIPAGSVDYAPEFYARESVQGSVALALTNPGDEELTVSVSLFGRDQTPDEMPLASKDVDLPAGAHVASYIAGLFRDVPQVADRQFEGRVRARAYVTAYGPDVPAQVSTLTLLTRGPKYTSMPAAPLVTAPEALTSFDDRVDAILSDMTLDEKLGQMTQAERGVLGDGSPVTTWLLGSVLSGGGSGPAVNQVEQWATMYDNFQQHALETRLGIPILYGIDALHGNNNVHGAVVFPHNIGLGATRDPELVERIGRVTASEVRAAGMNWTFAPCVTVPRDERWGRTYEGFSEDPELVRTLGEAVVRGYQGFSLNSPDAIVACAKHYLGDGGTTFGTGNPYLDQGDTQVDEATLRRIHLPGYLGAMDAGVATIMVSFSSWNGVKMSADHYLLTDLLKGELDFKGFLVSDWAAIDQLPGEYDDQVREAINAGLDMIMVPYRYQEFFETLKDLVQSGQVPISRIDDAVRRILRVKIAAGLLDRSPLTDPSFRQRFGSDEHRRLARQAVRESVVLLKNAGGLLPLSKSSGRILVTGSHADNVGYQCGGWTITWQGGSGPITPGTTILESIRSTVSPGTVVVSSANGTGATGADVAIVAVGEEPYAEGQGDRQDLHLSATDQQTIENVRQSGVPFVVVLISGRPLILGDIANQADAILAAWLPGTEGEGVADVLFGDYAPKGKLSFTWPRSMDQIPINVGDENYDPLFPFGYGLTY